MEGIYYKTWDSVGRRYLVKRDIDDEWELAPTPSCCITRGRKFNPDTNLFEPPPSLVGTKKVPIPRVWHSNEGRWVFVVNVVPKDAWTGESGSDEDELIDSDDGVDINEVRKKYF